MNGLTKISQIVIKNRIRKDYGNIEELAESIRQHGLLQPIVITPEKVLIAGERRLLAAKRLGWEEIPAVEKTACDREEQLLCEIAENEKRKEFTPSERVAYGLELEQIEKLKAKERQAVTQFKEGGERSSSSEDNREKSNRGIKTDSIVGKKVGMSESGYYRAKRVVESGNKEIVEKMDSGEIGINTAYEKIRKPQPKKEQPTPIIIPDKHDVDFSFLAKEPEETEEDNEFSDILNKMATDAEMMAELKAAICVQVVAEYVLKSLKEKLTQYPDTTENADNSDRKAFVKVFNILKKIVRKEVQ